MLRTWTLLVLVNVTARAQVFDELITTFDGANVYFTTRHDLRGGNRDQSPRLYLASGLGVPVLSDDLPRYGIAYMPSV
ncbi:MAG: hypothetical protein JNK48_02940, partial [Bryobacterales bacterium]|nr:hypothetical protein [Bryobacterales bacterium]